MKWSFTRDVFGRRRNIEKPEMERMYLELVGIEGERNGIVV